MEAISASFIQSDQSRALARARARARASARTATSRLALIALIALIVAASPGAARAAGADQPDGPAPAGASVPPPLPPPSQPAALPVAEPPATVRAGTPSPALPDWLRSLSIGGGAILWYFQPVSTGATRNVDLFFANLLLDGKFGAVGLHIEPRFRDSRLRAFFPGPVWAQEVYASVTLAPGTVIKAGKAYSHFGLFWDNSFYGNVQVYDGLKLDPDYGLSLEGAIHADAPSGLRYYAQYFLVDGQTNVSLAGRDTISVPDGQGGYARRRNQAILRIEPFFKPTDTTTITAGASGEFLQAALPGPVGTKNVLRAGGDLSVAIRHAAIWGEYIYQNGQTVTSFPIAGTPGTATSPAVPGQASAHNHYVLAGAQYVYRDVTLRYNVSTGRYGDLSISEWMHVPAVAVAVGNNLTVLGEYVSWTRYAPGGNSLVDRSVDVTLNGHF
jgi:hypothetical protein